MIGRYIKPLLTAITLAVAVSFSALTPAEARFGGFGGGGHFGGFGGHFGGGFGGHFGGGFAHPFGGFHPGFHPSFRHAFHPGFRHAFFHHRFRHAFFHHRFRHHRFFAAGVPYYYYSAYGYDSCWRRQWVRTHYGWRLRWLNYCDYGY